MSRDSELVIKAILNGRLDSNIDEVAEALRFRMQRTTQQKRQFINVGDIVIMNGKGTRYLQGVRCRVERKLKKNYVLVILDENVYFRGSKTLRCPPSLFDKEEKALGQVK